MRKALGLTILLALAVMVGCAKQVDEDGSANGNGCEACAPRASATASD